ncbi:hypothetical protein G6F57_000053 [Rhizopus arrhizus]|uniref:Uncharacterized protein n=1 Tax=Rhizopus oryzae TaxID=64495 RepID=A0A9P7BTC5_RHIOR|nr:hypothetical protein G6F23_001173 [Rhizopus arrhizus]KAG1416090.1 hypothetical protein G6F58_006148 [Rhizopus delemar]KAG0764860.1 hypothetical protein G6F24_004885 [Rhizopus arrhizus]KAG0791386.1 hypothetical protein G6F21_005123 [Rhizopus arrhizus]KAG0800315.1 hypothetical protein G6F22_002355 [Rhizopus arrhizus]
MVKFLSLTSSVTTLLLLSLSANGVAAATTCTVAKSGSDDTAAITKAFSDCKNGGTVVFSKDTTYNLNSILILSGLKNVNIELAGTIKLPGFDKAVKGLKSYIQLIGTNVKMYGGGVINGNGQAWYDAQDHTAPTVLRISANHSSVSDISIINSPRAHMGVTNATDVLIDNITLHTASTSNLPPKNTDALDVSRSSNIVFQNSKLTVGDDCLAINEEVTNITLSKITCNGGHGFSVGSLGKGGANQHVKTVRIHDSVCNDCQNGVRIKTWPGGKGSVSDIKFNNVELNNVENPILITTHYCDKNQMNYCTNNDKTSLSISDVVISDITGSASNDGNPIVSINCSTSTPCTDFTLSGVKITKASNTPKNVCVNLDGSSKIAECSA